MLQKTFEVQSGGVVNVKGGSRKLSMVVQEAGGMLPVSLIFDDPTDAERAAIEDADNYRVVATFAFEKIATATATDSKAA